jgi:outer membrane murein-binding lipoprotein Lpp
MLLQYFNINTNNVLSGQNTFTNNTVFQSPVIVNSSLDVESVSAWGNIHCVPQVDGNEAAIGFFRHSNKSVGASAGDVWLVGSNLFQANPVEFSIGTSTLGNCFLIDTVGNVSVPYNLIVSGINTNTAITTLSGNVSTNASAIATLSGNVSSLNSNVATLTSEVSTLTAQIANVALTQYFNTNLQTGSQNFYRLGTLWLPQGGHQAEIRITMCWGYNISPGVNRVPYNIQNYQLTLYIYSANGGSSRWVDAQSYPGTGSLQYNATGIYYSGFATCLSPYTQPLPSYIGLTPNPQSNVDIFVQAYAWAGIPLIQVSQTQGYFDRSTFHNFGGAMPSTGWSQLDTYSISTINVFQNINYAHYK